MLKRSLPQNRPRHHYYDLIEKQWLAVIVYSSRLELTKLGWESEPYVTHLLDGFSALSDPDTSYHLNTISLNSKIV